MGLRSELLIATGIFFEWKSDKHHSVEMFLRVEKLRFQLAERC
jgi:hypothetical protein